MTQSSCKRDTKSKSHPGTETRTGTSFPLRFDPSNSLGKQFFPIRLHSRNSLAASSSESSSKDTRFRKVTLRNLLLWSSGFPSVIFS